MLKLSLRSFGARKMRVALTLIAVALGVALIAGTYILTDTINKSFDNIFQTAAKGTDVSITSRDAVDADASQTSNTIPASFLSEIERQPGVAKAAGSVQTSNVALFKADGIASDGRAGRRPRSAPPSRRRSTRSPTHPAMLRSRTARSPCCSRRPTARTSRSATPSTSPAMAPSSR